MPRRANAVARTLLSDRATDFTSTSLAAVNWPASQAAKLSDVMSQVAAIPRSASTIRVGIQTAAIPARRARVISARVAAGRSPGCSPASMRPYCSIASRAM